MLPVQKVIYDFRVPCFVLVCRFTFIWDIDLVLRGNFINLTVLNVITYEYGYIVTKEKLCNNDGFLIVGILFCLVIDFAFKYHKRTFL